MTLTPALLQQPPGWASDELRTLLSHGVKFGGMNIRNPVEGADGLFEASQAASGVLVASLLDGTELELVSHRGQVRIASVAARKERMEREKAGRQAPPRKPSSGSNASGSVGFGSPLRHSN